MSSNLPVGSPSGYLSAASSMLLGVGGGASATLEAERSYRKDAKHDMLESPGKGDDASKYVAAALRRHPSPNVKMLSQVGFTRVESDSDLLHFLYGFSAESAADNELPCATLFFKRRKAIMVVMFPSHHPTTRIAVYFGPASPGSKRRMTLRFTSIRKLKDHILAVMCGEVKDLKVSLMRLQRQQGHEKSEKAEEREVRKQAKLTRIRAQRARVAALWKSSLLQKKRSFAQKWT